MVKSFFYRILKVIVMHLFHMGLVPEITKNVTSFARDGMEFFL